MKFLSEPGGADTPPPSERWLTWLPGLESENEQGEFKLLVAMKRLYAFYQAHDITDLADIEKDVSAIITKGKRRHSASRVLYFVFLI